METMDQNDTEMSWTQILQSRREALDEVSRLQRRLQVALDESSQRGAALQLMDTRREQLEEALAAATKAGETMARERAEFQDALNSSRMAVQGLARDREQIAQRKLQCERSLTTTLQKLADTEQERDKEREAHAEALQKLAVAERRNAQLRTQLADVPGPEDRHPQVAEQNREIERLCTQLTELGRERGSAERLAEREQARVRDLKEQLSGRDKLHQELAKAKHDRNEARAANVQLEQARVRLQNQLADLRERYSGGIVDKQDAAIQAAHAALAELIGCVE
jgi:chromosome segregation ATPase